MDPESKQAAAEPPPGRTSPFEWPWLVVALAMWALLTFGHGTGLKIAAQLFSWAKQPHTWLSDEGGAEGMRRFERGMAVIFCAFAVAVFGVVGWTLRRAPARRIGEALVPWAAWAVLVLVIRKVYIVYATEFVHFGQYALIGALVCRTIDGGRRPQVALLITWALGFGDEVWQHYGLHGDDPPHIHFMDWSDEVLDALGATGGILTFVTLQRVRGEETPDVSRGVRRAVLAIALLLFPLLLLDPVTTSWALGHYIQFPVWGEYTNDKPTHWPGPREGIPLNIAALLVLLALVDPRGRGLRAPALLALAVVLFVAIDPDSRKEGTPVHEVVPTLVAHRAPGPIRIDGVLDEPAWQAAQRVGPFVLNQTAGPAGHATYARVTWDAQAVYFAFEVEDDDVWARDTVRDDTTLPGDEVVELFLDVHGTELTYYEVEVSPRNVVYDLFNFVPQAPYDYDPDNPFVGLAQWSARPEGDRPGIETAVQVRGTLSTVTSGTEPAEPDADQGWTCEVAFPWSAMQTTTATWHTFRHHDLPPKPGDRWRLGLTRVERPRPRPVAKDAPPLDREGARAVIGCDPERMDGILAEGALRPIDPAAPADQARFDPARVALVAATERAELQGWSATRKATFHRPSKFGVLELAE